MSNGWSLQQHVSVKLFGKVTIMKTFLIPKLLYVSSIIETPVEIIKKMERMIFKFLWKGPDKVTRHSVINSMNNGGLNLIDLETQIKALRLSWIPRILDEREEPWKSYFRFCLKKYGGDCFLKCNYDIGDLDLELNCFYFELLVWWAEFRNTFSDVNYSRYVIWNNKDIRIDKKPVFYRSFVDKGIIYLHDLLFDFDNLQSYELAKQKGLNTNFLTWTALRSSVSKEIKSGIPSTVELDPMNLPETT